MPGPRQRGTSATVDVRCYADGVCSAAMRTLFWVAEREPTEPYARILEELGASVELRLASEAGEQEPLASDYDIVFIGLDLGLDRSCDACRVLESARMRAGTFTVILGEPKTLEEAGALAEAGAGTYFPLELATFRLRLRMLMPAVRTRLRVVGLMNDLNESKERYRSVVAALEEGVVVQDREGVITHVNPSAARILGLSEEDVKSRSARGEWVVTTPDGARVERGDLPAIVALRTGKPVNGRVLGVHHPNGQTTWISTNSHPVRNCPEDDQPSSVVSSITDITERRQAEQSFRDVLERAPDAVLVHHNGRALFVNRRWAELLGYEDARALVGFPILEWAPPRYREQIAARVKLRDQGQEAPPMQHSLLRRDGSEVEVAVFGFPLLFEGQPAAIAYARDLTDQRRLEMQLVAADRMASLGRLSATVGHELNNPLSYVIGNLERALVELAAPEGDRVQSREFLLEALEGAERMRNIVRDLRVFSRGEPDALGAVDIVRVLESCLRMAANELHHRAHVNREYARVPPVHGNEARLAQVFLNLLINAAQAQLPGGQGEHGITVRTRFDDGRVIVEVIDTGIGIAPDDLAQAFEPFFTTKRDAGGTGLGLSVCQALVHSQGGTIHITSELGRGTTVAVALRAAEQQLPAEPSRPVVLPRLRLLLIDDQPALADLLRHHLAAHEVTIALGGHEAIAELDRGGDFDLVLCDIMMPSLGGVDVFEHAQRGRPELARRFVFMTGGAFTARELEFLATTRNVCLEKPFRESELLAALGRALELARERV